MALTISTNAPSLAHLNFINKMLAKHTERLSSGLRINSASDDPAGYAVATNLHSTQRSVSQAIRNTNDGASFIQTAEGANSEVQNLVTRMRELAVQGSSSTLTSSQRTNLQTELDEIVTEISRVSANTEFNDISLTNGSTPTLSVQVGPNGGSSNQVTMTFGDLRTSTLGIDSISLANATTSSAAITTIDTALDTLSGYAAQYGATQSRFDSNISNLEIYRSNLQSSYSGIMDADYALESAAFSKFQTQQQAAIAVMAQANINRQAILQLLG